MFAELAARIERFAQTGRRLVPLHIGDTCLAPPHAARDVLARLDGHDTELYRYGDTAGLISLRAAVAERARATGLVVEPQDDVLVANGATHALFCAARAVLDAGDEVLVASPYWPLAPGIFTACGAIPVDVPLTQKLYDDPSFDAGTALSSAIRPRTKAIYVISPNNPDGKVLSRRDLERIAAVALEHDLWVFSDEVYADTVFDGEHVSIASLPGMADRTIVLHSTSKSHALAGCRVGFAVAPAPVVASARRISTHSGFNVSVAMQRVALAALADAQFPAEARRVYREARDRATHALAGSPIDVHRAEGGAYLFLDFRRAFEAMTPANRGARPLLTLLERAVDEGVLLAPGDAFGVEYDACARLCFAAVPMAEVALGIDRLRSALDAMGAGAPLLSR